MDTKRSVWRADAHELPTVSVPDGPFKALVIRPFGVFGVNRDVQTGCTEMASNEFVAIAPDLDLFWRDAPGLALDSWSESEWAQGFACMKSTTLSWVLGPLLLYPAFART